MIPQALHAAFATLLLVLAAMGAGSPLWRLLGDSYSRWERLTLSLLAGWGLLSLALYLIGQWKFSKDTVLSVVAGFAVMGMRFFWRIRGQKQESRVPFVPRAWLPAGLVIGVLAMTAVGGLAPVVGDWGSDTVAYHLLGPKVWLRMGAIRPVADNSHTAFPQTAETMDAALMAIGGPAAAGFADSVTFALLLAMCGSLAMRAGLDACGGWWAAALVATMPAVFSGAHGAFVDGLFATFLLATIRVALSAVSTGEWTAFGVFRGLLIATKYTGLLAVLILAAGVLFLQRSRNEEERAHGTEVAWAAFATLLVAAPYYLRNWLLLGCPIYPPPPGLVEACLSKYLPTQAILDFHQYILQRGAGMGRGLLAFCALPFNLTYHTANFHGAGGIGLVPLGLAPIGIYAQRKSVVARFLTLVSFLLTAAWFLTQQESRFLIHAYAISTVLGVAGWQMAGQFGGRFARGLAGTLVSLSVLYGIFMIAKAEADPIRAVLSAEYSAMRQERDIPYAESFAYLNREDTVKKVLILDRSVPPFYLEKNYIKPVGQWGELTIAGVTNPVQMLGRVKGDGVTHVLDVSSELSGFQVESPGDGLQLVFQAKHQRIYRVK